MKNFLLDFLSRRPLILAPMEGINDIIFRELCMNYGCDVTVTEFISSEALIRSVEKSIQKIKKIEKEPFLWVQIFGHDASTMRKAAEKVVEFGADVIDLNFGCPVKKIVSKGAGAALLKDLNKLQGIASEVVKHVNVPVTAKIRLGWDEQSINVRDTVLRLQDAGISLVSIHARTRAQMYGGKARWEFIEQVTNDQAVKIPIIGNGDITDGQIAQKALETTRIAGLMIGRAAIGNPFIFKQIKHYFQTKQELVIPLEERKNVFLLHLQRSIELKGEKRGVLEMRRHIPHYFKGIPHFKERKVRLLQASSLEEIVHLIENL
ncbi:MAG: tRNA dihydrouridine synthase DusB [Bacteroidales bacterium]|nr:tRNA dihydrouridine synthase DusB [Bacteroidales bacterium]